MYKFTSKKNIKRKVIKKPNLSPLSIYILIKFTLYVHITLRYIYI